MNQNYKDTNLKIAQFMGASTPFVKNFESSSGEVEIEFIEIKSAPLSYRKEGVFLHTVDELKYHTDIQWQMPVIDQIESEGFNFSIISSGDFYWSEIKSKSEWKTLPHGHYLSRNEAIYQGILTYLNSLKND